MSRTSRLFKLMDALRGSEDRGCAVARGWSGAGGYRKAAVNPANTLSPGAGSK